MGNKRRIWSFRGIALVLPVLLLVVVEVLLRLFGYGHDTSLFVRYPDNPDDWVMNKYASERYFSDTVNETRGSIEPFAVAKAPGTFRIFVLGESTTAGYPYFHNGSFDRWLKFRLMHEHPDVHFEVVNVSLTAVNSYTVLDFGKQVIDYQPDAVLVYVGHNEYYGALGVGSTSRFGNSRWMVQALLTLRRLRLLQLIGRLFSGLRSGGETLDEKENLMQRMAARQRIGYGSADYYAGIQQFRDNMDELCRVMKDAGVPVFLSTLVSNEKDCKPFVGGSSVFALGDSAFAAGDYVAAKRDYDMARDSDMLRFRAPSAINGVIRELTGKFPTVHLVEAERLFDSCSPHEIVGNSTLLEHVHPNLFGYALLSEAFYRAMGKVRLFTNGGGGGMNFEELLAKMPVTAVDSLNGAYTIMMLKTRWPFHERLPAGFRRGNSIEEQLAGALAVGRINWLDAMNQLFQYGQRTGDKQMALRAVEAVSLEYPDNATYKIFASRLCLELGDQKGADFYLRQMRR
jgi:lysophospholipase L1-like esterase